LLVRLSVFGQALGTFVYYLFAWRPHIVHLHVSQRGSFYRKAIFSTLARMSGKQVVWHSHGSEFDHFYDQASRPLRRIVLGVLNRADVVLVLSQHWRAYLAGIGATSRIEVLFNPVVLPPAGAVPVGSHPGVVLALGRLGQRKGTYDILKAVPRVIRYCPEACFWLAGDGEVAEVRAVVQEDGLGEHVCVLGWLDSEAKAQSLRQASLLLLPSYGEGQAVAVLEALAYGLPVVATPVGGIPDAISDGVNGYLIQPGDVEALAARIISLLKDPQLRQTLGENGRRTVATTFAVDHILQQLYAIYEDIVTTS
jgi:glycosyltransferase involved in cell wall biosynthesis